VGYVVYIAAMSMHIKIYDTDTVQDIARKIYEDFDVMASCSIYGFVMHELEHKLIPKGELVIEELRRMDEKENMGIGAAGGRYRKYKYRKDSVGGPIAHKIFTWEKRVVESEPRYTIWRYQ
jgi:hypothetical protein